MPQVFEDEKAYSDNGTRRLSDGVMSVDSLGLPRTIDPMKFLPTAFAQLRFAWKLYNYAVEGRIDLEKLDVPLSFKEGNALLVLAGRIFDTPNDLILAFENNLGITF